MVAETPSTQRVIALRPEQELAERIDVEARRRRQSAPAMILAIIDEQLPKLVIAPREEARP